jgi:thymidylate synthase ThyX
MQMGIWRAANVAYEGALRMGIAKEVARCVLPEGLTPSRLFMAGSLRSWVHYCDLRCEYKTQKEHRLIAEACRVILIEQFPDLADVICGKKRSDPEQLVKDMLAALRGEAPADVAERAEEWLEAA